MEWKDLIAAIDPSVPAMPVNMNSPDFVVQLSQAVSLRRIADALEKLAEPIQIEGSQYSQSNVTFVDLMGAIGGHDFAKAESPEWVPARPGNKGDPVGYFPEKDGLKNWGFWDETWSNWRGGFPNEDRARIGLEQYAATL